MNFTFQFTKLNARPGRLVFKRKILLDVEADV